MKGILKTNITTSNGELIPQGTKVEIINGWCGCDGYEYQCIFPDKRIFVISYNSIEITDNSPYVNWEQRRYEIAKDCLASIFPSTRKETDVYESKKYAAVWQAVDYADELIKKLKGE